jgi:hypothetical protein
MSKKYILSCAVSVLFLSGCVSTGKKPDDGYLIGNYANAALLGDTNLGFVDEAGLLLPVEPKAGSVLEHLDVAENYRLSGNLLRSSEHYDAIEYLFKDEDTEGLVTKAGESIGSLLVNDNMRSYEPTPTERVLVNYYKALNFWSESNIDFTRVEFNRANERTRIAIERYAEEIKEKNKNVNSEQLESNEEAHVLSDAVNSWEVYDNFMNPAVAFTNALFLSSQSDHTNADTLMKRVESMVEVQKPEIFDMKDINDGYFWVITETGLGPMLDENRYDIPWKVGDEFIVLSIALPTVKPRQSTVNPSTYTLNGKYLSMQALGSMEKLAKTELKKRWSGILTRAIASAVAKGVIQKAAAKENIYVGFAASLISAVTTSADKRIWGKTPANWSVTKVKNNGDNLLSIPYAQTSHQVSLPSNGSGIVYIKQPTSSSKPYVSIVAL